jgi:hypothetical protein
MRLFTLGIQAHLANIPTQSPHLSIAKMVIESM